MVPYLEELKKKKKNPPMTKSVTEAWSRVNKVFMFLVRTPPEPPHQ